VIELPVPLGSRLLEEVLYAYGEPKSPTSTEDAKS
jgi:hypothetical protein